MEQLRNQDKPSIFIFPNLHSEVGEIERVGKYFGIEDKNFVEKFINKASSLSLIPLSEDIWNNLENTDSVDIAKNDWESVAYHANQVDRDWKSLRTKIDNGESLDAPIIAKSEDIYHLVSGNTRLMVSKAVGAIPNVLIVDIDTLD